MNRQFDFAQAFLLNRPAEAAAALETMSASDSAEFLAAADETAVAPVLAEMSGRAATEILSRMRPSNAVAILKKMPANDVARLLRTTQSDIRQKWESGLPKRMAARVRGFLSYSVDQVGAWTETDLSELRADQTIQEARETMRLADFAVEDPLFLVGAGRKFAGVIWLATFLGAKGDRKLRSLATPDFTPLYDRSRIQLVLEHDVWSRARKAPVIDRTNRLVGKLRFEMVRRALDLSQRPEDVEMEASAPNGLLQMGRLYIGTLSNAFQLLMSRRAVSASEAAESTKDEA